MFLSVDKNGKNARDCRQFWHLNPAFGCLESLFCPLVQHGLKKAKSKQRETPREPQEHVPESGHFACVFGP